MTTSSPIRMKAPRVLVVLLCALSLVACATAGEVRRTNKELTKFLLKIEEAARICAPRAFARAQVNLEFAVYESSAGQPIRAKTHMERAKKAAKIAFTKSRGPECEKDSDLDGIKDSKDKCPTEPEDYDGDRDDDGCPEFDRDGDGIDDESDRCPDVKEDRDGFQDQDGCPDPDNDRDGIKDVVDQCPNQPEDRDGFQDLDGCPDPDNDRDGIPDVRDKCPNQREDFDGDRDEDGCPDAKKKKYKKIVVTKKRIKLKQKIFFKFDSAVILPKSFDLLDEVADALSDRPKAFVRIEGHTDSKGRKSYNKRLSQRRAESVRKYLISKGVKAPNLTAVGYGEERPRWSNKSRSGRSKNRRVEFHIVRQ